MKKYFQSLRINAGFTLIELLVVIGILGILAAALIATIDPFEQLKKAQDANTKNTAVEFVNANIGYYTTHNGMPWYATDKGGVSGCVTSASDLTSVTSCISSSLIADGELKAGFINATNILKNIRYFGLSATPGVTACFLPVSKSQQKDANTKYDTSGVATTFASCQAGSACYWCAN